MAKKNPCPAPDRVERLGLYVHFPYCRQKCHYCDFNAHAVPFDEQAYTNAVLEELQHRAPEFCTRFGNFGTIYFGGGTPSLWSATEVRRVIEEVRNLGLCPDAEVTLEANPGTISFENLEAYRQVGINRFSIGVQSLRTSDLQILGRLHNSADARNAVHAAVQTGARVTVDLIYALHQQTFAKLEASVRELIALEPGHISAYTLTVEPNTPLGKRQASGRFKSMDEDHQANMIEQLSDFLETHGFVRYEVSNYARPGQKAIHNSIYWTGGAYLGVGAGAHSYFPDETLRRAVRTENLRPPEAYIAATMANEARFEFTEELGRADLVGERAMLALRTLYGLDVDRLDRQAQAEGRIRHALLPTFEELEKRKLIAHQGPRFVPTKNGFLFGDTIGRAVLSAVDKIRPILDSR